MALYSQTIKNLKGGISQQPDILRFPDQGQAQINGFSSEVQGLQKRPPSVHIKRLRESVAGGKPLVKLINRDEFERYYAMFHSGGLIQVFDLAGELKTVNAPQGTAYLQTPNPRDDLRIVTVADYTFIVNKRVMVQADATKTAHPGYRMLGRALINIKSGQYGRKYTVSFNSFTVTHETPDGSQPTHSKDIDTQVIADALKAKLTTAFGSTGWTAISGPSYVLVTAPAGTDVANLKTEDGFNNQAMQGVVFDAQRFNMLPAQGPDGYIVKVSGDPGSGADDYYVKYSAAELVWKETVKPGEILGMDNTTMPHVLVREADGTFTFRAAKWEERAAGDDDSNPLPSFMDQGINDVFFFRNRLGLLSGENIILTRSGEFFSFFPKSVVASPDTDPVDVAVSHNRVSRLNHAVPFAEELLLWSDQTQFVLRSDGALSPRSVRVDQSTEFESAIVARPVPAGRSVYFAAPRASFTSIRRYYSVQDVSAVKNAEDMTAHVPSYIPNGVYFLGSSTTENVVTVLTAGAENKVFMYKYLYLDEQLVQQSWSHWEFPVNHRILACEFVAAEMYVLRDTPDGLYLERIEFTQNTRDLPEEPFRVHADRKMIVKGSAIKYDPNTDQSWCELQELYGITSTPVEQWWYVRDDGRAIKEAPVQIGGKWSIPFGRGDQRARTFAIGQRYEFLYEFSKFMIKVEDQNGTRTEDVGRLQIRRAYVNYENSGPFSVEICGNYTYTMSGKRLGAYILGEAAQDSGQFQFPVMQNSRDCRAIIKSDSPSPVAIIGAGWNGVYWRREKPL